MSSFFLKKENKPKVKEAFNKILDISEILRSDLDGSAISDDIDNFIGNYADDLNIEL